MELSIARDSRDISALVEGNAHRLDDRCELRVDRRWLLRELRHHEHRLFECCDVVELGQELLMAHMMGRKVDEL